MRWSIRGAPHRRAWGANLTASSRFSPVGRAGVRVLHHVYFAPVLFHLARYDLRDHGSRQLIFCRPKGNLGARA